MQDKKGFEIIEIYNLFDPLCEFYPDKKLYSWRTVFSLEQDRIYIYFFFVSQSFYQNIKISRNSKQLYI